MMTNLFSIFDPSSSLMNISLNWLSTFIGLLMILSSYWFMPSRNLILWNNIVMTLYKEFKMLLGLSSHNETFMIFMSMFSLILFNNFMGLFPYIFTSTSQLSLTLTLPWPMWISFMIYGWLNNTNYLFAHLVPQGTPTILLPFMVSIETISNMMRPSTLAIQLSENMIDGHLWMTLWGNTSPSLLMWIINILMIVSFY